MTTQTAATVAVAGGDGPVAVATSATAPGAPLTSAAPVAWRVPGSELQVTVCVGGWVDILFLS